MVNDLSRTALERRKKYHAREQEKARRKMIAWQERYDMHAQAHWECTKRLIEEARAADMAPIDAAIDEHDSISADEMAEIDAAIEEENAAAALRSQ